MGSPKANAQGILDPKVVTALHTAAKLLEEPLAAGSGGSLVRLGAGGALLTVEVPHHGIARVKLSIVQ